MLVRIVEVYRRGTAVLFPGDTLDTDGPELGYLIETGMAVPERDADTHARETRRAS